MTWQETGDDRWQHTDDVPRLRHVLVKSGEWYFEAHGQAVHVYRGPREVADEAWPLGSAEHVDNPVTVWQGTFDVPDLGRSEVEGWPWTPLQEFADEWTRARPDGPQR